MQALAQLLKKPKKMSLSQFAVVLPQLCTTGQLWFIHEELPYAVGSSEDGALTAALVTRSEKAVCAIGIGAKTAVARSAV